MSDEVMTEPFKWEIPGLQYAELLHAIAEASPEQRGRWWCAMNCWKWPFAEMPVPAADLVIPRAQFEVILAALGSRGGDAAATRIWRERIARHEDCAGPASSILANVRYER